MRRMIRKYSRPLDFFGLTPKPGIVGITGGGVTGGTTLDIGGRGGVGGGGGITGGTGGITGGRGGTG